MGKEALEEIHKEMSLEAVEQLLLEKADAEAVQRQVEGCQSLRPRHAHHATISDSFIGVRNVLQAVMHTLAMSTWLPCEGLHLKMGVRNGLATEADVKLDCCREIEEALAGKLEAVDEEAMERELEALSTAMAQATSTAAESPSGTGEFPIVPTEVPGEHPAKSNPMLQATAPEARAYVTYVCSACWSNRGCGSRRGGRGRRPCSFASTACASVSVYACLGRHHVPVPQRAVAAPRLDCHYLCLTA